MRPRSSLVVLLLAGCNRIFGLAPVVERDAVFYDAHVDAPFGCPAFGTAPSFDHGQIVQVLAQHCGTFSLSEDSTRALALCEGGIFEGAADGSLLAAAPGLEGVPGVRYAVPRLGPDGMTASVVRYNIDPSGVNPTTSDAVLVARDSTTWREAATVLARPASVILSMSEPTRGPGSHVIVALANRELHEVVDTGAGWEDRYTFTFPNYGPLSHIQLSPDGLRAWWELGFEVYYADRPTMNDPFTPVGPVPGASGFGNSFITGDCGWIFFATLDRIWRAPRAS